jgi:ATP-dependent RNA helicase HelY
MDPGAVAGLASTRTYPLNSSFRPSYNMAVNLTGWAGRARASALLESSFAQFQADRGVVGLARQVRKNRAALADLAAAMTCDKGDFAEYAQLRRTLSYREGDLSRTRASSRRAEAVRSLALLRPGDIIRVPGGRRAGLAVVLQPGLHQARGTSTGRGPAGRDIGGHRAPADRGADGGNGRPAGPGPLVLTEGRQVKRLAIADFAVPPEVIDKIRIPNWFSPRSPEHRKDLAATMRNRLAGRAGSGGAGKGRVRAANNGHGEYDEGPEEVAELRRRLRRHPCHDCPDREDHARYAERYLRLARETDTLEHRVAGRSHVIARTFDRVCRVLERLGYLDGDTVTADGRRLARLYSELDLLAAECMRRGLWDGLSPAELAACVSALSFESRQPDDTHPPRLPKGRSPEVLAEMVRTWSELDQLEKDNDLSFLREPDLGFAWAAYRWARGVKLESVLDESPDLTPGDFVRSVKQLIDLLDQIASAAPVPAAAPSDPAPAPAPTSDPAPAPAATSDPPSAPAATSDPAPAPAPTSGPAAAHASAATSGRAPRSLSATARAAIDAMRRGVIAYSAVAD